MTSMPVLRIGMAAVVLGAAALVQGCTPQPSAMMATTQQTMVPAKSAYTGVYSGEEWYQSLNSAMTSDNGGGD